MPAYKLLTFLRISKMTVQSSMKLSFWLHSFCGYCEGWNPVNRFIDTSWVATDRPKSVRNRCVIELFGGVCVLSRCFLGFSVGVGDFCHMTESNLFLFLLRRIFHPSIYLFIGLWQKQVSTQPVNWLPSELNKDLVVLLVVASWQKPMLDFLPLWASLFQNTTYIYCIS